MPSQLANPDPFNGSWTHDPKVAFCDTTDEDACDVLHVVVKTIRYVYVIVQRLAWHVFLLKRQRPHVNGWNLATPVAILAFNTH